MDPLLTERDVALHLGVLPSHVKPMEERGEIPRAMRINVKGGPLRWRASDFEDRSRRWDSTEVSKFFRVNPNMIGRMLITGALSKPENGTWSTQQIADCVESAIHQPGALD